MKLGPLNLFSRKATVKKNGIDFQRLEDRLLFSGSPLADVSAGKAGASDHLPDPAAVVAAESHPATVDPVTADHAIQPGPVTPEAPMGVAAVKAAHRLEVLVVDSAVKDAQAFAQSLISSASSNVDIKLVMLDANNGPALDQITQALAQISGGTHSVDAIHLVTHAEAGEISIGSTIITSDQLAAGTVTSAAMESWHNYLAQGADVLLYGCDVAKGSSGIQFINHLAQVTGADVAASNDLTGAASLGGNWTLEASTGHIETGILSSTMGVLLPTGATPTVTISAPSTVFIGQNVNFDVNFTNSGTVDTGYGPYIDVLLPRNGMDGHAGTDTPDGIGTGTVTATILGSTMTATSDYVFTDNDGGDPTTGTFTHPFAKDATGAPIVLTGTVGDRILVYQLPFGSLVPNQPAIDLHLSVQSSNLADLGAPLPIHVNGGFMYGSDPLDNPVADNPIFQKPYSDTSAWTSASVTPKLLTLTKTYNGPEGETATGPNFQRSYTVNLDIASGQTITNLDVTDLLPSNAQFVSVTGITDGGVVNNVLTGGLTATTSTPGGEVGVTFASISDGHAQFDINFYVSRTDQSSGVVIDASSGSPVSVDNNVAALGDWTPIDVRDAGGVDNVSAGGLGAPAENTFTAKSIAIQKGWSIVNDVGTAGLSPGDTVEFTLNFQISDYFGFQNVVVTDTLSDGWRLDSHFDPTLTVNGNSWILPSAAFTGILWGSDIYGNSILTAANVAHTVNTDNNGATPATDGKSTLAFDVSQELVSRGENDQLLGGGLHAIGPTPTTDLPNSLTGGGVTNDGPTTGIIKFHAVVQEKYSDTYPSGHPQVTQGDTMSNDVNVTGDVLDNNNFIGGTGKYGVTGHNESDTSSVTGTVSGSSLQKSIYAVNGNAVGPFNQISPGDDITYRLRYIIPTGNIDTMTLKDYLPLPVFNVDDPNSDGVASGLGEWTFDPTVSAAAPSAGTYKFGPTEDYSTYVNAHPNGTPGAGNPTFSIDTQSNVLQWSYGTYDSPSDNQQVIDLLFTVKVNAKPFADKLVLTNQASSNEGSTQLVFSSNNQIIPIVLSEPNVIIDKGVVASDQGPSVGTVGGLTFADVGSDGFTGTLSGLANATAIGALNLTSGILPDAGDKVRFALVAMNTGGSDAFDVTVTDTIKNSYVSTYADAAAFASGTNFKVYRGSDGTHPLTAGTDYSLTWNAGTKSFQVVLADNFDTGDVTDNKHGGLNRARDASGTDLTDGKNSIVVLYDLTLKSDVLASSMVTNTASLTEYRGAPGGGNYLAAPLTDTADVKTVAPALVKDLFSSEVISADNALNQAVIGEIVTYTIDVTLPEGQMNNLKLDDALGSGLGFVNVESVTFSNPGAISTANTINAGNSIDGSNHVSLSGSTLTFDLGNVTNTDSDNSTAEHITIKFKAVVLDVISNQQNTALTNHASSTYDSTDNTGAVTHLTTSSISAPNVTVIEPTLALSTLVANNTDVQAFAASVRADAGDLLQYKIVITNANGANDRDAFDLALSDAIPAQLSGLSIVSVNSTGTIQVGGATVAPAAGDFTLAGNTLSNTSNIDMLKNSSITIVVQGTFAGATGSTVANTADVKWTSLDGDYSANRAVGVTSGVERTGADGILNGGSLNDYQVQSTANVTSAILVFKSVVDTSQSATSGSNVAIGEVVRYRLVTTLGEGAAANFQIEDNLPTGMRFLNDGSANYVFISTGAAAITSTGITNIAGLAGTTIQGSTATVLALTSAQITGTFNDNNISTTIAGTGTGDATLYNSGQPVFFRLGNLSNSDSDVDNEYVVIEFNAVVENIQANQSGTTLSNNYTVLVDTNGDGKPGYVNLIRDMDGSGTINAGDVTSIATDTNNDATTGTIIPATSAPATLNVVEPNLGITKSVTATTGAAVTYKVVITNPAAANASTAFDSNFSDILNGANLTLSGHSISSTAGVTGITDTSAANTVSYTIGMIPVGESVTVTYSANVLTTPSGATTIDNTASATTTSLDGTTISSPFHGTVAGTLGAAGSSTGERSGSDGEGAGLNNYAVSATEKLGSVGDKVWFDVNGNGVQDAGEPGIASAPVSLRWAGPDGIFGNGDDSLISTTTDASGGYSFNALPIDSPGQFRVTVDTSGAPFTTYGLTAETYDKDGIGTANQSTFSLVSATPNPRDQDFGYRGAGSIGDLVWHDQNSNGIKDAAEQGIPNVTVTLTWYGFDGVSGGGDDITYTTTTDSSGLYSFAHLPSGNFSVAVSAATLPANVSPTYDLDGTGSANSTAISLSNGQVRTDADFGYVGTGTIGDTVWYDVDGSGTQNHSEPGIAGATVTLLFGGRDGNLATAADNITYSTTTDSSGHYSFSGLFGGDFNGGSPNYKVTVSAPAGYSTQTYDSDGTGSANNSSLRLANGETNNVQDFGYRGPGSQGIGDFVWEDTNGNGRQDAGELGVDGVAVSLFDSAGSVLATTTTAGGGFYSFGNLVASAVFGNYRVQFTAPTGMSFTLQNSASATSATDSDPDRIGATIGRTGLVTVTAGLINNDIDAGVYTPAALGDRVWNDLNGNGIQDAGEPGIAGLTVSMYNDLNHDGDYLDPGEGLVATTTTGSNGAYSFAGLIPGDYIVVVTPPASSTCTFDKDDYTVHANDGSAKVTLSSGETDNAVDFGYQGSASIGDYVWYDANHDGVQGASEPPIPGVRVYLDINGNGSWDSATEPSAVTNAAGNYSITGLIGDSYTARVDTSTLPAGYVATSDKDGSSSANVTSFALGATQDLTDVDWGYIGTLTVSGRSYHDHNKDGTYNGADTGLGGVTVELISDTNNNGVVDAGDYTVYSTTTSADGTYSFSTVISGNYIIRETQPSGYGDMEHSSLLIHIAVAGTNITGQNFGHTTGSLSGTVFSDLNDNGAKNAGESGISGVAVKLEWSGADGVFGTADDRSVSTLTDGSGNYTFDLSNTSGFVSNGNSTSGLLSTGIYRIIETTPSAFIDGADMAGNASTAAGTVTAGTESAAWLLAHPGSGTGRGADSITGIQIGIAQDAAGYTFGEILPSSIRGSVHEDPNDNGRRDGGEKGISGNHVTLTGNDVYGRPVSLSATTDSSGNFVFTNLYQSDLTGYKLIQPTQPVGYKDGREGAGSAGGNIGNDHIDNIVLSVNTTATDYTFGELLIPAPELPHPGTGGSNSTEVVLGSYFYNSFQNFQGDSQTDDQHLNFLLSPPFHDVQPILPIMPMYSGHAEPGSTVVIEIRNIRGAEIGSETIVADAGGNWLAKFPGNVIYDTPTMVIETVTRASYSTSLDEEFNFRTYFCPAINPSQFFSEPYDVNKVFSENSRDKEDSLQKSLGQPQNFEWNSFNYEFLAQPGIPSA